MRGVTYVVDLTARQRASRAAPSGWPGERAARAEAAGARTAHVPARRRGTCWRWPRDRVELLQHASPLVVHSLGRFLHGLPADGTARCARPRANRDAAGGVEALTFAADSPRNRPADDQGGPPTPATSQLLHGGTVRMAYGHGRPRRCTPSWPACARARAGHPLHGRAASTRCPWQSAAERWPAYSATDTAVLRGTGRRMAVGWATRPRSPRANRVAETLSVRMPIQPDIAARPGRADFRHDGVDIGGWNCMTPYRSAATGGLAFGDVVGHKITFQVDHEQVRNCSARTP